MSAAVGRAADLAQRGIVAGLAVVSVLGLVGAYQASQARLAYARKLNEEYYRMHPSERPHRPSIEH
ncbi:hypothetical protein RI367_006101 [Sorochytrium milnesiophthora]